VLIKNSNIYISHCGGDVWGELMEKGDVVDYRFLASIWVANNFPSIVISAKNLGLIFLLYIADCP
ncbi:MAG: hypothetical protein OEV45_14475, partial [Desulfobacteraceae bacterium]|nr:hypothetical protein [Desulfobacteraceae bacterium]